MYLRGNLNQNKKKQNKTRSLNRHRGQNQKPIKFFVHNNQVSLPRNIVEDFFDKIKKNQHQYDQTPAQKSPTLVVMKFTIEQYRFLVFTTLVHPSLVIKTIELVCMIYNREQRRCLKK